MSPSGWSDDHHTPTHVATRSPSPEETDKKFEHKIHRPKNDVPNIVIARHRTNTETQYADTEVSLIDFSKIYKKNFLF